MTSHENVRVKSKSRAKLLQDSSKDVVQDNSHLVNTKSCGKSRAKENSMMITRLQNNKEKSISGTDYKKVYMCKYPSLSKYM